MAGIKPRRESRNAKLQTFVADGARTAPVYLYDIAVLETDGHVASFQAGGLGGGIGVVVGVLDQSGIPAGSVRSGVATRYLPSASAGKVMVSTDPDEEFVIESNGVLAADAVGANADIAQGTADALLGISGIKLDTVTVATTATLPLRIVGRVEEVGNDWGSANPMKLIVRLNNHQARNTTGV